MSALEGFRCIDEKISGGPEIYQNSVALLLYKIALSEDDMYNGIFLESSYSPDVPVLVKVSEETLLKGIYEGLLGMHGGGSVRLIVIPPDMGFGERGYGEVPANATLYAEVCVVSVEAQAG